MKDTISPRDREVINETIATLRLEGLTPSKEVICDAERVARGEITKDEAVTNVINRVLNRA